LLVKIDMKLGIHFILFFLFQNILAQYHPPAGEIGSSAIFKDSLVFNDWAANCEIKRGYKDISIPDSAYASYGFPDAAIGKAGENGVVSLGDSGIAILTFNYSIINGLGPDFAVFENSINNSFLELAFVEVSSDGENFFRFSSISLTQTDSQVGSFGEVDATKINNLAGKYRANFGTPFDLEEFKDSSGIDINNITHIKIIDAIGSIIDSLASFDSKGNKINDPWPTPFESSGFDFDAVGVINNSNSSGENTIFNMKGIIKFSPNPVKDILEIYSVNNQSYNIEIFDLTGKILVQRRLNKYCRLNINFSKFKAGIYFLRYKNEYGYNTNKIIKK